uniref:(northern house mosquito) hypothetical protein n=1 Tax=Culex pipiens TaxID=7175 RepID=A0A8D8AR38_CULPI
MAFYSLESGQSLSYLFIVDVVFKIFPIISHFSEFLRKDVRKPSNAKDAAVRLQRGQRSAGRRSDPSGCGHIVPGNGSGRPRSHPRPGHPGRPDQGVPPDAVPGAGSDHRADFAAHDRVRGRS